MLLVSTLLIGGGILGIWMSRSEEAKQTTAELGDGFAYGPKFLRAVGPYGCADAPDPFRCLEGSLYDQLLVDGVGSVLARVEQISQAVAPEPFGCHALVHALGRRHVQNSGVDGLLSVKDSTLVCEAGFVHGAFEAAGHYVDISVLRSAASEICSSLEGERGNECIHAAGHAFSIKHPRDLEAALAECDAFGEPGLTCGDGILMAYSLGSPPMGETYDPDMDPSWYWMGFDKETAPGACMRIRENWRPGCWEYLWNAFYLIDGLGVDSYYQQCPTVPGDDQTQCWRNGGRLKAMLADDLDTGSIVESCQTLRAGRFECVYGVAWFYANQDKYLSNDDELQSRVCDLVSGPGWTDRDRNACSEGRRRAVQD